MRLFVVLTLACILALIVSCLAGISRLDNPETLSNFPVMAATFSDSSPFALIISTILSGSSGVLLTTALEGSATSSSGSSGGSSGGSSNATTGYGTGYGTDPGTNYGTDPGTNYGTAPSYVASVPATAPVKTSKRK